MVYVVANDGQPLMPTERHGKVCRMLKSGMAKVVKKCPFTIQLQYESERNVQPVSLLMPGANILEYLQLQKQKYYMNLM